MLSSVKISISSISTSGTTVQWLCELQRGRTSVSVTQPKYNDDFCFLSHADSVCTRLHVCVHECLCAFVLVFRHAVYVCLGMGRSICVHEHACVFLCVDYLPPTSLRLCVDHTLPYGTALWRYTVAQMDTFCAGHILNDPPIAIWTTALISHGGLLGRGNRTGSTHWE